MTFNNLPSVGSFWSNDGKDDANNGKDSSKDEKWQGSHR